MRKVILIILSSVMMLIMSGCKSDIPESNQDVNTPAPTKANSPTEPAKTEEVAEEDDIILQPGFEAWEGTEAVKALNKVLLMEADMKLVTNDGADTATLDVTRLDTIKQIQEYSFDKNMAPDKYAVVDMDYDGTPEVIVNLSVNSDYWVMLLRFHEGSVYGYFYVSRGLQSPKMNGRYMASSGVFDNKILEMSFDGYILKENCLAYSMSVNDGVEYYIADNKVTEKEYNEFSNEYYNSDDVMWYMFPSNVRAGYNGEKLLQVNFDAITQPTGIALESYYSEIEKDKTFSHSSRIPGELCDVITEAMKSGKEEEIISPLVVGTELSQEDFCSLTGFEVEYGGSVSPFRVDIDNDGTEDLIGQYYWGGTGGFSSMEFYKGNDNGTYSLSNNFDCLLQEFKFIAYQGKNFLLMKNVDYNTKYYSGYTLYLYEDGTLADGMQFRFDIKDYDMSILYENSSFSGIEQIRKTLSNKKMPEVLDYNDGVIYGTGEIIDEANDADYQYSSDIDNDGKIEYYNKYMWYPSNMGTVMQCIYYFKESKVLEDLYDRLAEEIGESRLYTFWLDKVDDKNVMYLYYGNNLDFSLYAYLLEGAK